MKKIIVSTTIQEPTESIKKFDSMKDWTLIVAGDLKTPKNYKLENGIYFSPEDQEKYNKELSDLIGWNSHARRNFALLLAKDMGADIIALVDDDNIPLENWGSDLILGKNTTVKYYNVEDYAFDPIGATNYPNLWHRGFPMQIVSKRDYSDLKNEEIKADVQADFWNGDPDIDAIERMIYAPSCEFGDQYFPMASNKPAPFNSQNVFITKEVLPYYFVLPHISPAGRQSDIWISYHIASLGFKVVFCKPSVYQKRNEHDITKDMEDEFIGYQKNIDIVKQIENKSYDYKKIWPEKTVKAYQIYRSLF